MDAEGPIPRERLYRASTQYEQGD